MKRLYSVAGRLLSIYTLDEWSTLAVSNHHAGCYVNQVENSASSPDAIISIIAGSAPPQIPPGLTTFDISDAVVCHTDRTTSYLDFDGSLVMMSASNEVSVWIDQPCDFSSPVVAQILSQAFSAALRRCNLFEFHSGAVVPPHETTALLFAGASGSGKSTLTAQLASSGWSYMSDDTLLLKESDDKVVAVALREFFALTATSMATLPATPTASIDLQAKGRFAPQDFFSAPQIASAVPSAVVFPRITGETHSQLRRLTASETMSRFLKLCPWSCYDNVSAGHHLALLGRLAQNVAGFDMLAGTDLLRDPSRSVELAHQAYARN
jgi:hypothetical protein